MVSLITSLVSDHTFQIVAIGTGLLGWISGITGTYVTLRGESLLGDALSHSALPGIAIAFLIVQDKQTLPLLIGASIIGVMATALIKFIHKRSVAKFDSALSLILTSFFGLGLVLMTYIQRHGNSHQAGLSNFIFGQASAMLRSDVHLILMASIIVMITILFCWKPFKVLIFDADFAYTRYTYAHVFEVVLALLVVLTIMIGLESVGVVLVSSLLIGPSIAARQWSNHLPTVMILSGILGGLSGILGTLTSSLINHIPTGPTIILWISLIVIISILFAPQRGIIAQFYRRQQHQKHIARYIEEEHS